MLKWLKEKLGVEKLEKDLHNLQVERDTLANEVQVYRKQEEANKAKYDSKEPWVDIRSDDFSDTRGIRIELDWNTAFIEHLKESGIKGANEEEVVQKWLAMLYQHLIEKLEAKSIDRKDEEGTVSDYV